MNDKKTIDRLFQEKFKNFEVTPDETVWEKIKARQENGRKRAILLPLWYKVSGVAVAILLILTIGYVSFDNESTLEETIVIKSNDIEENLVDSKKFPDKTFKTTDPSKEIIVVTKEEKETTAEIEKSNNDNASSESGQGNYYTPAQTKVNAVTVTQKEKVSISDAPVKKQDLTPSTNSSNQDVVAHSNQTENLVDGTPAQHKENVEANTLANNTSIPGTKTENTSEIQKENSRYETPQKNQKKHHTSHIAENIPLETNRNKPEEDKDTIETKEKTDKKSIFEAIDEKDEVIATDAKSSKKWNIAPNVAPVYYNVFGSGSSIDPQFADNTKDGEVNLSYGVHISYTINERLSVRSGVSKVDLSYGTQDVAFAASTNGQNLQSIDYSPNAEAILVSDIGNQNNNVTSDFTRAPVSQTQNVGLLNQRIGYIEVPMEMKYALVNKKFGVNMIGGVSTLFLQNNEISIEAGDFESPVGEANNLNEVSFSGNIGLGLDYKFTKQLQLNLEPIFKYQFNAFNGNAENFRPYYFGIYTGISIKF